MTYCDKHVSSRECFFVVTIIRLNILDLRTLDVCLACGYPWWQWGVLLIHLIYVLAINLRIPAMTWGNLWIGLDARFHPAFSGRNFGAVFEVLCIVLNIMNLKLFDTYRLINSLIIVVTLEYLGDTRVGWCVSCCVILVRILR